MFGNVVLPVWHDPRFITAQDNTWRETNRAFLHFHLCVLHVEFHSTGVLLWQRFWIWADMILYQRFSILTWCNIKLPTTLCKGNHTVDIRPRNKVLNMRVDCRRRVMHVSSECLNSTLGVVKTLLQSTFLKFSGFNCTEMGQILLGM